MNPANPPLGRITLIFTDIEESSRMTNALGEVYREKLLPEHNRRVREVVAARNGYVVKTIGDSFMLAFEQPAAAVACAAALQEAVGKPALTATDDAGKVWTVNIRVGVHRSGEPLQPRSSPECAADYFGSDVNFAARVESLGAGGQILVSDSTYDAANYGASEQWKAWPNRRIKSFDQPETVWEFLWDGQSRGEPGARFLPDWFKGEQNRYIPRPELESAVLAHFGKLRPDGSVPRIVTLHAYGGMGKTRLAVACAVQTVGAFKDGVFFVRLDDRPPTTAAVAEALGAALGLAREAALPDKVIATLRDKDLLLLLDNYESVDSEEVQTFLIELLRSTSGIRLLVTGREAVKLSDVEQEVSLDGGMTGAEADGLFLARARLKLPQGQQWQPDEGQQADIRRIVRLSERIPVAIELAAAWVSHSTVKEIADGIEATPLGSESKEPPRSARLDQALRHRSLTRSLNYSYERLEPEAQAGFARLGLFAGSFAFDSVAGACGLPQAKELLFRLQDASLIHRVESDGRSRFTMLRPTRAYAAEKLDALPEASSLRQQYIRYFREAAAQRESLTGLTAETSAKVDALDWFEEEWPNILVAAKRALELHDCTAVLSISRTLFEFRQVRRHWAEIEELYRIALAASKESGDRSGEGVTLHNLGGVLTSQNRLGEAEAAYHQSLAICRELGDRRGEGTTLNNLAAVYRAQGRWAEAERVCQQSLGIYREFQDRHGEGNALHNLGNVYQAQSRWAEAETAYQKSLAILREFKEVHGEGVILNNLGSVYLSQGRLAEAEKAYQQSLDVSRQFKSRHGEGAALHSLGGVYLSQGRWMEAETAHRQSLAITREFKDRYGEGQTLNGLGLVYQHQGRWTEAEKAYQQSLAIKREFHDRLSEGHTLNNLGNVYRSQGRGGEAEQVFQRSLAIKREFKDRHGEGQTLTNLGGAYYMQGRWVEAEGVYQQSLAILRDFADGNGEAQALTGLGNAYQALGRWAEALQAHQRSLSILREFKDRVGTAGPLNNIGMVYYAQREWAQAEQAYAEGLAIYREFKDRNNEGLALGNLGLVYHAQSRWVEAAHAFRQAIEIKREFKHRQSEGLMLNSLGLVYKAQSQWVEAAQVFQQALEIKRECKDRLGEGQVANSLGKVYRAQGRWADAAQAFQQSLAVARELKDPGSEVSVLYDLAMLKGSQGDRAGMVGFIRQALPVLEMMGDQSRLQSARDILKRLEV